ncbi:hypothetical protein H0H93_003839 [Arthromyces matolae]|nr:hypothetical protein H0H93_003839 [Arthromyces matolae]
MNAGATLRNCKRGSQPPLKKAPTIPKPPKPPAPPCAPRATSFKCSIVIMPDSNAVFNQQCQQRLELLGKRALERLCWGGLMREFVICSTNTAAKITANLKAEFASSPAMQKSPLELVGYILLMEDMVSLESARQGKTRFLAPYFKPEYVYFDFCSATFGRVCKWPNVVFISLSKGSLAINYPSLTLWNEDDGSRDAHQSRSLSPLTSSSESELPLPGDSNWNKHYNQHQESDPDNYWFQLPEGPLHTPYYNLNVQIRRQASSIAKYRSVAVRNWEMEGLPNYLKTLFKLLSDLQLLISFLDHINLPAHGTSKHGHIIILHACVCFGDHGLNPLIDHIVNLHFYLSMAVTARLYKVNCLQNAMDQLNKFSDLLHYIVFYFCENIDRSLWDPHSVAELAEALSIHEGLHQLEEAAENYSVLNLFPDGISVFDFTSALEADFESASSYVLMDCSSVCLGTKGVDGILKKFLYSLLDGTKEFSITFLPLRHQALVKVMDIFARQLARLITEIKKTSLKRARWHPPEQRKHPKSEPGSKDTAMMAS